MEGRDLLSIVKSIHDMFQQCNYNGSCVNLMTFCNDVLKEAELNQKYEGILHDRIVAEKDKFRVEIGEYIGRTRGIEKAIDGRF